MNNGTKRIIRKINDSQPIDLNYFGEAISPILFSVDKAALCCFDNSFYLLTPEGTKNNQDVAFRGIIEVLSYLDDLEKNHLIFVHSQSCDLDDGKPYLFYEGKKHVRNCQNPHSWEIGNNQFLQLKDSTTFSIEKNAREVLQSTLLPEPINEELKRFFFSNIYPTSKLDTYIKKGFRTNEQRALRLSMISLIIAVLLPVLAIFLSNRWGYVTIDKEQFRQLISGRQSSDYNPTSAFPILSPKNQ